MKNTNTILTAGLAVLFTSQIVMAEVEVSAEVIHESASFAKSGTTIGAVSSHDSKDVFKSETSIKLFFDGEMDPLMDDATFHIELNPMADTKGINDYYDSNKSYTQRDLLREAYVDTEVGDFSIRAGKQQVVWGTADGMKLLDLINPTDFSEMAQNQMEDSRITTWMLNAETDLESGANFQAVISQPRENIFAGLNRDIDTSARANDAATGADLTTADGHDQGHAFIMKGVDTITGKQNGFLNVTPDLGSISLGFYGTFATDFANPAALQGFNNFTVGDFTNTSDTILSSGAFGTTMKTYGDLGLDGGDVLGAFAGNYDSNLTNADYDSSSPDTAFEYMNRATFATFDTFVNASSQYVYDMPDSTDADVAFRFKDSTNDGLNYSLNYSYNYDKNPVIDINWKNTNGETLKVNKTVDGGTGYTTLTLTDAAGGQYGGYANGGASAGYANLVFTQTMKRAHNIGGAVDMAIETESLGPVVLRGEALYQKDVYSPVINRGELSIGNLTEALKMTKGDRFKYVLGADITVMTNMMVSAQFIQDRNLDYVDSDTDHDGSACNGINNCGIYTADFATMSMSNQFNKAEKNKEFYSLFFSKPFGESQEHRWNNIFMFEENGGKWNRLDAEFALSDDMLITTEYNKYWGDENTQFGQLEASSNVQLGFKYTF